MPDGIIIIIHCGGAKTTTFEINTILIIFEVLRWKKTVLANFGKVFIRYEKNSRVKQNVRQMAYAHGDAF